MEKPWIKRIFSTGFVLMLIAALCACENSAEKERENIPPPDSDLYASNDMSATDISGHANTALAKENVYRVSEVEIPDLADSGNKSYNIYRNT